MPWTDSKEAETNLGLYYFHNVLHMFSYSVQKLIDL